jgi:hypothetical protein
MAWRQSLARQFWKAIWSVVFYLDRNQPWLWRKIVTIRVLLPWWRDRAIVNFVFSVRWLLPVLKEILTDAGKNRLLQWYDRNYASAALRKKYPWLPKP